MGPGRGSLSSGSGPFLATAGVTCMVLVVLLPDLDALQDKGEAETLYLEAQEPAWSPRVL